jgi:hypothetical protein
VSDLPAERPEAEEAALALRADAKAAIDAARALLAAPVFERQIPLALLTKLASDETVPIRERRRCAEVLAQLQLRAIETLAGITGAKEQRLRDLGIDAAPSEVNVVQHNTTIEIVREGAPDWRRTVTEAP